MSAEPTDEVFFRSALARSRIRILRLPGIGTAGEAAAPYAFPFEGSSGGAGAADITDCFTWFPPLYKEFA